MDLQIFGQRFCYVKGDVKVVYKICKHYCSAGPGGQNIHCFCARNLRTVYRQIENRFSIEPVHALCRFQNIQVLYLVKNPAYKPVYAASRYLYARLFIQKACYFPLVPMLSSKHIAKNQVGYHIVSYDKAFFLVLG